MSAPLSREIVRAQIAELAGCAPADVTGDANLMDLGLDSLRAMSLAERWVAQGIPVDFAELAEVPTLDHWWSVLARHVEAAG